MFGSRKKHGKKKKTFHCQMKGSIAGAFSLCYTLVILPIEGHKKYCSYVVLAIRFLKLAV